MTNQPKTSDDQSETSDHVEEEAIENDDGVRMTTLAKAANPSDEVMDQLGKEAVDSLNKSSVESGDRDERWEKIWAVERSKWPHNMGNLLRTDIPEELHQTLDSCITRSQNIAREFCQTQELTDEYLKRNTDQTNDK